MPCASLSRYSSVSIRASSSGLLKNPISIKIVGTSAKLNPVKSERCTIPLFLRQPQPDCKVQLFLGLISAGSTADKGFFGRVAVWRNRLLHTLTGHFMSGINADDFLRKRQNFESIGTVLPHDGQICSVGGAGSGSGDALDAQVGSFISVPQILQKCAVSSTLLPQFKQILLILSPPSIFVQINYFYRHYYVNL